MEGMASISSGPLLLDLGRANVMHEAALSVLERTGLRLEHPGAEALLLDAGARRDGEGRVLIPGELVEQALAQAPRSFVLADREGADALQLESGRSYFGPGSDALHQIDAETGERRDACLEDVGRNVRLAEALGFDFAMSMALPREVTGPELYPRVFAQMVRHTSRPIVFTAISRDDVEQIHQIAALVAGGVEALRARPLCVAYLEPISPLHFDRTSVDRLLYCAEQAIPFIFAPGSNCGIGAPISPEGGVVQGTAESLAGLVIATLQVREGGGAVRFVFGANTSAADMRSGLIAYGAPEWTRTVTMYAELARHYDLPSWGTAGSTDAQQIDAQAAWEAYRGIVLAVLSRPTLVHDMGYMALGEQFDPRMLVLAREMLDEARHLLRPADLSAEALCTEVIDEVARRRSLYLGHPHTRKNFRRMLWLSTLVSREKIGRTPEPLGDRLARRVSTAMAGEPRALNQRLDAEVERYLATLAA
jgi:trimethylamine--corrinoid protein Co-methyltransferase